MSVNLQCTRVKETDNAVLIEEDDFGEIWIPLSQVESMHFDKNGHGKIVITDWIAKQKGLN